MAKTYKAKTKDDEVSDKKDVVVEETELVDQVTELTLDSIDNKITQLEAVLAHWQAVRVDVDNEAKKVKLKT